MTIRSNRRIAAFIAGPRRVIVTASDCEAGAAVIERLQPSWVICEIHFASPFECQGFQLLDAALKASPDCRVVLLTSDQSSLFIRRRWRAVPLQSCESRPMRERFVLCWDCRWRIHPVVWSIACRNWKRSSATSCSFRTFNRFSSSASMEETRSDSNRCPIYRRRAVHGSVVSFRLRPPARGGGRV